MRRRKTPKKLKKRTESEIRRLLERGAKSAAALDERFKRASALTAKQRNLVLD